MRGRRELAGVLALAALLRLAVLLAAAGSPGRYWSEDDRDYIGLTDHLHAGYLDGPGRWFDVGLLRTPVYPFFLRAIFEVFGRHYVAVTAAQLVIGAATVALTYWLAQLVLPERYALGAALLLSIDPASIVFGNIMLTETLFAFLLTLTLGLVVLARQNNAHVLGVAAGLVLGVGILTRPVSEYLPIVLALALVLTRRRSAALLAVAVILGAAIPAGAWAIRNHAKTGVTTVSTIDGHNMLFYRAVGALEESGKSHHAAETDVRLRLRKRLHGEENAAEVSRIELRLGLYILFQHPVGAAKSWARGEAKLLVGPAKAETATLLTGRRHVHSSWLRAVVALAAAVTIGILVLAAAGVGLNRSLDIWLLVAAAGYLIVISGGPEAYSRFRVPVTPVLAILAAAGVRAVRVRLR
jgi:4-amino-4-deoxy-L-arabinose transferase-like glycosyltransferase